MSAIKHLVSKKKKRFKEDGFDLDLSYITDNIIAMGYPSEGIEGSYRNNLKDVQRFFDHFHKGHFKVYNLCAERSYPPQHFDNSVAHYPFADHNPPPFEMIMRFCMDCRDFMQKDANNVVAIHCKAGKGRTGTLIVCLLLYLGICDNAHDALVYFARERTKNMKGVTIPSQKRYCFYFDWYLKNWIDEPLFSNDGVPLFICGFRLTKVCNFDVGGGCDPYFKIFDGNGRKLYNSKKQGPKVVAWREEPTILIDNFKIPVRGDCKIVFMDYDALSADDKMFQFWFHTSFISSKSLRLEKLQLDGAHKDKKSKHFDPEFTCEILFPHFGDDTKDERVTKPYEVKPVNAYMLIKNDGDDDDDDELELDDIVMYRWACEDNDIPPPPPPPDNDDDDDVPPPPPPDDEKAPAPPSSSPSSSKCGECNCTEFVAHAFKKQQCNNCFHKH